VKDRASSRDPEADEAAAWGTRRDATFPKLPSAFSGRGRPCAAGIRTPAAPRHAIPWNRCAGPASRAVAVPGRCAPPESRNRFVRITAAPAFAHRIRALGKREAGGFVRAAGDGAAPIWAGIGVRQVSAPLPQVVEFEITGRGYMSKIGRDNYPMRS
jgi:hypothetical protein